MWRDKHHLRAMDIAAALAFLHPSEYWGMDAADVVNVYEYLQRHQDIPENPFAEWQTMRGMRTHPHWRYYVICASSCNIQRMQNSLAKSLLPVHMHSEMSERRRRYPVFQHHPITKRSPPEPHPHPEKPLTSSLAYKMSSTNPIPPIDDICARWPGLWAQGDLLDSLICCQMFPDQHHMNDDSIAYVLRISYSGCAGMTGKDVVELYEFFLANPAFRSNPITYWQNTKNQNVKDPADRHLVTLAILRFGRKSRPKGKGR
ncbi:hypothetical protein IMSHALPRED_007459 [Imshaugia aleurites]|uniref:Uncharacterized protein n=1 Tax=Imshaugia aleurites TaxID=172621 RepID=A0A8H3IHP5_9LECA|nr:hypothetical protein IMSHALPRED_007459 [Imshaugia aleurites]